MDQGTSFIITYVSKNLTRGMNRIGVRHSGQLLFELVATWVVQSSQKACPQSSTHIFSAVRSFKHTGHLKSTYTCCPFANRMGGMGGPMGSTHRALFVCLAGLDDIGFVQCNSHKDVPFICREWSRREEKTKIRRHQWSMMYQNCRRIFVQRICL